MRGLLLGVLVSLLVVLGAPATARAQTVVKPEFLLIVDTSGSMRASTGTGTNSCGTTKNRANDAACVVRNIADGIGDAIFGMQTFGLDCSATVPAGVPTPWSPPNYFRRDSSAASTGLNGASYGCGLTSCVFPFPAAVPAATAFPSFPYSWYGCNDAGRVWVPISESNQSLLRSYGDNVFSSCTAAPAVGAVGGPDISYQFLEDRAGRPSGFTPLAGTLKHAGLYIRNQLPGTPSPYVNFNATGLVDPLSQCRPLNIILLTDGDECDTTDGSNCNRAASSMGARLNARNIGCMQVDLNGNNTIENPIPMSDPNPALRGKFEANIDTNGDGDCFDAGEQRAFRTRVYVIGFGTACTTATIESIAQDGGSPSHVIAGCNNNNPVFGYYGTDQASVSAAINEIVASSALVERCNGLDDDCDGQTDEDWPLKNTVCSAGTGTCRATGTLRCNAAQDDLFCANAGGTALTPLPAGTEASIATCGNMLDDDCDGLTDCQDPNCGTIGSCRPGCNQPELCDGLDNNCNGQTDEGSPGAGQPCGNAIGRCTVGTTACTGGTLVCTGGVQPTTETCNNIDDNCNGATDEGLTQVCGSAVGECRQGVRLCVAGTFTGNPCLGEIVAGTEVCDGRDNDCDGMTDDNIAAGGPCGANAIGICRPGTIQCMGGSFQCVGGQQPRAETCNNQDDDCNGATDDNASGTGGACTASGVTFPLGTPAGECRQGSLLCVNGAIVCNGTIGPATETCDGRDNDCDGMTDEGLGGMACGSTGCTQGTTRCIAGRLECMGGSTAMPETCNGMDDDCDGMTDEGNPGGGTPCGMSTGRCSPGVNVCRNGMLVCDGGVQPSTETCNGADDDCDGMTDEDLPNVGMPCGQMRGECVPGIRRCLSGVEVCEGEIAPRAEECNCKDDDCDGLTDNMAVGGSPLCGDNSVCAGAPHCGCLRPCTNGAEFRCPVGRRCETVDGQELCTGDPCATVRCNAATETCVNGTCQARCQGVNCTAPLVCNPINGTCVSNDCRVLNNCGTGQLCREGMCQSDPCLNVNCPTDQACFNGVCRATCDDVTCPSGQTCRQGLCGPSDMCANVTCGDGQSCNPATGMCQPSRCTGGRQCGTGQICEALTGRCVDDPCLVVRCPTGLSCRNGDCVPPPQPPTIPADRVLGTGGGGVACSVSVPGSSGPRRATLAWVGLLAGVLTARGLRRRARRAVREN